MPRSGRTANASYQKKLEEYLDSLEVQRVEDLRAIMNTESGRRWYWQTYFDQLLKEIPTHSNTAMTDGVALRNEARAKIIEARKECPEQFWQAFEEGEKRSRLHEMMLKSLEKESGKGTDQVRIDDGGEGGDDSE